MGFEREVFDSSARHSSKPVADLAGSYEEHNASSSLISISILLIISIFPMDVTNPTAEFSVLN